MLARSADWQDSVTLLQHQPHNTFDHRLGTTLAACDTDSQALAVLVDIITEDPPSTHEYVVAARMFSHFTGTTL
ncbi:hypothetical protein NONO_c59800 [Nocardia nova SH22a]|uniref:Uncharacterized protein n=1 Tax=Nocardia nova SH22a TaxID=1415166 RepID=W5TU74_9NOCA|nr:hypothetical protein [Nocardia nova]AHH20756.1 hypothetical protein NONO_c59800 [Nocardia nova SH22a]